MPRGVAGWLCASLAVGLVGAAVRADPGERGVRSFAGEVSASRSLGWPWRGRLAGGVKLAPSDQLVYADADAERDQFYGTVELVGMLERAVARVERQLPGSRVVAGELSKRYGGDVIGHKSHENGRDADVGFYLRDEAGQPVHTRRFVNIYRAGRGRLNDEPVYFDERRNWLFVQALMEDEDALLQHVFVASWIRRRLLREARRQGVDRDLYERARQLIIPPDVRHPHHNHFHIRIYCAATDVPGCRDRGPYWPWLPDDHPFAELARLQAEAR